MFTTISLTDRLPIIMENNTFDIPTNTIIMKKITLMLSLCIAGFAAGAQQNYPSPVGGQRDEHGCLVGAGQTWSVLKNRCVQVFNDGLQLTATDPNAATAAYVIFSDDKKKAEIFLTELGKSSVVLDIGKDKSYSNGLYELVPVAAGYRIKKVIYATAKK